MKEVAKEILTIHEEHSRSYSDDEGYALINIITKHEEELLPLFNLAWISELMYEDGDHGIIHTIIGKNLETVELIMATSAIQICWEVFENYLEIAMDYDTDSFYIDYLTTLYGGNRDAFWTDLYEIVLANGQVRDLFEYLIQTLEDTTI